MKPLLSFVLLLSVTGSAIAGDAAVSLKVKKDTVDVTIGGKSFAVYNFNNDLPKPFFSPVRGADGTILTRPINDPNDKDHPHHKGIWVAVDEVNEVKFWAEKGKIKSVSVKAIQVKGNPAKLEVVNLWLGPDKNPVVIENTVISIFANRLLAYDITFIAGEEPATFRDTKEGLLGFRMAAGMKERETGKVVNADGLEGTKECWGKTSNWVDYYGEVDGKTFGLTIMDHPKNFRKSRYHVRNYGLFSVSPFGEKAYTGGANPAAPETIQPGKSLRLRYAMYIHNGDTKEAKVAQAYKSYVSSAD